MCRKGTSLPTVIRICTTIILIALVTACVSPTPTPTVQEFRETRDHVILTDRPIAQSVLTVRHDDRVEVEVSIKQRGDLWASCGPPSVKDTFGNTLAKLSPVTLEAGVEAVYKFSFFAASNGTYAVEFDNRECDIRETPAEADVTWRVY